ncbi:MAG: GAF and ANTAR domain-containing protein [Marmoricola sp.]
MASLEMVIRQLAEAARSMQEQTSTQATLDEAVVIATEIIDGCNLAGMSVVNATGITTPAGSSEVLKRLDGLQFELQEGPCYDAVHLHEVVIGRDLENDERWPNWGPRVAREIGVRSIVSYRLFSGENTLGAMNLYSLRKDAFDLEDIHSGGALAAHVAVALVEAQNVTNLETAIDVRTGIGRAEGILMERFDLSPAQAFAVLRRASQAHNVKLAKVAEELVRTRRTPT